MALGDKKTTAQAAHEKGKDVGAAKLTEAVDQTVNDVRVEDSHRDDTEVEIVMTQKRRRSAPQRVSPAALRAAQRARTAADEAELADFLAALDDEPDLPPPPPPFDDDMPDQDGQDNQDENAAAGEDQQQSAAGRTPRLDVGVDQEIDSDLDAVPDDEGKAESVEAALTDDGVMAGGVAVADLTEAERLAAEDRAFEENPFGTGLDPDAVQDYDYDYENSQETDSVDYRPSDNGFSDDFTNYEGSDPYSRQFGTEARKKKGKGSGLGEWDEDVVTDDDEEDEDEDDEDEDDEDDEDEADDEEAGEDDADDAGGNAAAAGNNKLGAKAIAANLLADKLKSKLPKLPKKKKKEKTAEQQEKEKQKAEKAKEKAQQNEKIHWKKGMPITVKVLSEVWRDVKKIKPVQPLIKAANEGLKMAMMTIPGNWVFRVYNYCKFMMGDDSDLIGSMLKLALSMGIAAKLLDALLLIPPVYSTLTMIMVIAVPIINGVNKAVAIKNKAKKK